MKQQNIWVGEKLAWVLLTYQLLLIAVMALLWCFKVGVIAAHSALIGGGVYWFPQLLFSWWTLGKKPNTASAGHMLLDFYTGSGLKWIVTVLLFCIVLKMMTVSMLPFFVSYSICLIFQCVGMLVLNNRY